MDEITTSSPAFAKPNVVGSTVDWKEILETELSKIEWKLRFAGCDHYFFVNNRGKETDIEFFADRLTIKNKTLFGKDTTIVDYVEFGWITLYLKDLKIENDGDVLHFVGIQNKGLFMTLKNVDKKWSKRLLNKER